MGISEATFYNWKKYGGMGISEQRELRQLKEENTKLKQIVADLILDRQILDVIKKAPKPIQHKAFCHYLVDRYYASVRRGCRLMFLGDSMYYYPITGGKILRLEAESDRSPLPGFVTDMAGFTSC